MAWRTLTLEDLAARLSQHEIDEYRLSAGFVEGKTPDPALALLEQTADRVRGYCRQNVAIRLSPTEHEIPYDLIAPALDICMFDVLKRMPMDVKDPRRLAYERALDLLDKVAAGDYLPEPYGSTDDENDRVLPLYALSFRPTLLSEGIDDGGGIPAETASDASEGA